MEAAQVVLRDGGLSCVSKQKPKERVKVDTTHERLAWWMWPPPWQDDSLAIYAGLFMGRPRVPTTLPNLPDLLLALHVDPSSLRGARLRGDTEWMRTANEWVLGASGGVLRELCTGPSNWEILRCRTSSKEILDAADPGARLVEWMEEQAQEWVDHGIAKRLAQLL